MHVLRLCTVYAAPAVALRVPGFDQIGGMQVHTGRLTRELDAVGIEQTVITAHRPGAPATETVGDRSRVVRAGYPIRRFRQLYGVAAIREVRSAPAPDLVHVHLGEDVSIVPLARWAAARAAAPLVATVHCSLRHTLAPHGTRSAAVRAAGGPLQTWLLRSAAAVFVVADRLSALLATDGVARDRLHVLPMGVDPVAEPAPPPPAWMDGRRWIVFAGRFVPEKGVRDLLQAFARLSEPSAGLAFIGDGPERAALQAVAARLGISDRVMLTGALPHADVQRALRHAHAVVLPSWFEERGRVLLEAMAAGTPVVGTRTGGIPETVRDGVNGFLVPPHDVAALACAIERILRDATLAAAMGAAGRATAAHHAVGALVSTTLLTYRSVLRRAAERLRPAPAGVTVR
jgi:glycogen synthase